MTMSSASPTSRRAAAASPDRKEMVLRAGPGLRHHRVHASAHGGGRGSMPARLGRWHRKRGPACFMARPSQSARARRVKTYSIQAGSSVSYVSAACGLRRRSLRHATEVAHRDAWLERRIAPYAATTRWGVEILQCRRLIKGYSDTHARGQSKFDQVMRPSSSSRRRTPPIGRAACATRP